MKGILLGLAAGLIVSATILLSAISGAGILVRDATDAETTSTGHTSNSANYVASAQVSQPQALPHDSIEANGLPALGRSPQYNINPAEVLSQAKNYNVVVAILDTGIDSLHEDLAGKVVAQKNFTASLSPDDLNGHGTHVAGIVAAIGDNGIGMSGVARQAKLLNVKVADDYGSCEVDNVARGIGWATDNGAQVINVSLELREPSEVLEQAVEYAWSHGSIVIAAAGNDGNSVAVYPAGYEKSIAVAAIDAENGLAPLSNHGQWVDVAAPGFEIYSTLPNNAYGYETGTSFAAAEVSGLAALLYGVLEDHNGNGRVNDEVRDAIESGCVRIDGLDVADGKIDIDRSLSLVVDWQHS